MFQLKILDQLESNLSEMELDFSHPLDYSDLEEALDDPPPLEMEEQELQEKGKKDSTFIWDIGLEEEQEMEMDLNCSFQDPDYKELEESFMSGKGRGVKKKKESVAGG